MVQIFCLLFLILPARAQEHANPFTLVETFELANGLQVHLADVPGDPTARVQIMVPLGFQEDPPGLEGLAHLTEHLMFTAPEGLTEVEFHEQITSLGGEPNATTRPWDSHFHVTVPSEHLIFALGWLYHVVAIEGYTRDGLERERTVIELENSQPWGAGRWTVALLDWWLEPPGRLERVYGLPDPRRERLVYPYGSLQRITLEDVVAFHRAQLSSRAASLFVGGDLDREEVLEVLAQTFALLPEGPEEVQPVPATPSRLRNQFELDPFAELATCSIFLYFHALDEADWLRISIARAWLDERLDDQLRFGEDKLAYGVDVSYSHRPGAAYLEIEVEVDPERLEDTRRIIETELEALRTASVPEGELETTRKDLVEHYRADNQTAVDLAYWHESAYGRDRTWAFRDPVRAASEVTPAELAVFMQRAQQEIEVSRPLPGGALAWFLAEFGWILVCGWGWSRVWRSPRPGRRLRYASWLWMGWRDWVWGLLVTPPAAVLGLVLLALYIGALLWVELLLQRVDSFVLYEAVTFVSHLAWTGLVLGVLAHAPLRVAVLTDEIRFQSVFFHSWRYSLEGLTVEGPMGWWAAMRRTERFVAPMSSWGLLIRPREGLPWVVNVRDRPELRTVIEESQQARSTVPVEP